MKIRYQITNQINTRKLFILYSLLQTFYWCMVCAVNSFAAVLLGDKGFSSSQIGIALAVSNSLAVFLQPSVSGLADRKENPITLHRLILIFTLAGAITYLITGLPKSCSILIIIAFILAGAISQILQPLTNSISVYYTNHGVTIDFGKARGIGSVSYAATSTILGIAAEHFGSPAIVAFGSLFFVLTAIPVMTMPMVSDHGDQVVAERKSISEKSILENASGSPVSGYTENTENSENVGNTGLISFIRKYPSFFIILIGIAIIFTFHCMAGNYMIYIVEACGGGTSEMGTALSISAFSELPVMMLFSMLVKKFGSRRLMIFSAFFFFCKAAGLWYSHSIPVLYAFQPLQMLAYAVFIPSSVYFTNEVMDSCDTFRGQGYMTSATMFGAVIGSLLGGFLIDHGGVGALTLANVILAGVGAVFVFIGIIRK